MAVKLFWNKRMESFSGGSQEKVRGIFIEYGINSQVRSAEKVKYVSSTLNQSLVNTIAEAEAELN